jgi:hypothetical protein
VLRFLVQRVKRLNVGVELRYQQPRKRLLNVDGAGLKVANFLAEDVKPSFNQVRPIPKRMKKKHVDCSALQLGMSEKKVQT